MTEPTEIIGYWFAASDVLPHGDGRKVVIGETLRVEGEIIPCEHGLHASVHPFDALQYAPGPMLYKVRLSGKIIAHEGDKHVASERTALACCDASDMLRAFARRIALSVIHLWDAPVVVREYLETGDENKREAAWAAAGAAGAGAGVSAWAAARAAWAAARAAGAAEAAAWAGAGAAAGAGAGASAWAAAGAAGAAEAAAWAAARKLLNEMVDALFDAS